MMMLNIILWFYFPFVFSKIKKKFSVSENQSIGSEIGVINSSSVDFKTVSFLSIMRTPVDQYFHIDSISGRIRLKRQLDREVVCPDSPKECTMNFKVKILTNENIVDVSVIIIDINDNVPKFVDDEYRLKISEASKVGSELPLPIATDKDSESHGIMKYRIISDSLNKDVERDFKILVVKQNKVIVPVLKQIQPLDRENIQKYKFYLRCEDTDGKYGETLINLDVDDANDNYPQWIGLPYQVKVKECEKLNQPLFILSASDLDQGGYGSIVYKINPLAESLVKSHFHLYGTKLFLSTSLDYENNLHRRILVPVSAIDEGGLTNTTNVEVLVEDCNDNNPVIIVVYPKSGNDNSYYNSQNEKLSIDENDDKEINVVSIDVTDADSGENGKINCDLENYKDYFRLSLLNDDNDKGLLFTLVKNQGYSFDREKTSIVKVEIGCKDNGLSPRITRQSLMILINDINDNEPKLISGFNFNIMENNENGAMVGRFEGSDLDENENKAIEYFLMSESIENIFHLTKEGQLYVNKKLDRESVNQYKLQIQLRDKKEPRKSSFYNITVNVLDDNDGVPIYTGERSFQIVESYGESITQTVIGQLSAVDHDENLNGAIEFLLDPIKIVPSVMRNSYTISKNGLLSVRGNLDREKIPIHQLLIIIQDKGDKPQSTTVQITIHLMDINDNKPIFSFPTEKENTINVTVDLIIGTVIAVIKAEDKDQGNNGTVNFECRPISNYFSVEKNGEVALKRSLSQSNGHFIPRHTINIRAYDLGNRSLQEYTRLYVFVSEIHTDSPRKGEAYENFMNNNDKKNEETGAFNPNFQQKRKHMNIIVLMIMVVLVMIIFFTVVAVLTCMYFKKERFTFFGAVSSHRNTEKAGINYTSHKTNQPCEISRMVSYPNLTNNPINEYSIKGEPINGDQYNPETALRNSTNFYNTLSLPDSNVGTFQKNPNEYQNRNSSTTSADLHHKITLLNYSHFLEQNEFREQEKEDYFSLNHNIITNPDSNIRLNNSQVQPRINETEVIDCRIDYKTPQSQKRSMKINSSFV